MGFYETVFSVRFRVKNGLKKAELDYWIFNTAATMQIH